MPIDVQAEYDAILERFYQGLLLYLQEKREIMSQPHPDYRIEACDTFHQMIIDGCRTLNHAEYRNATFFSIMNNIARDVASLVSDQRDPNAERIVSAIERRIKRLDIDRIINKI